jgi:hypothetical protein
MSVAIRLCTVHGIYSGGVDWFDLAQDRDNWRAVVTTAMNVRCPLNVDQLLTRRRTLGFQRTTLYHVLR